ncbi:MAG: 2-hydroxy-3-oxopropionate reductase, partial [Solirubrobacterales bacterium]|nr:2-hydroxy-3-oxopropionate reductase [Solirubrobacterales bacterium]
MTNEAHRPVVGWIGLGEMGLPMAGNLAQAGFSVLALDRDAARMESAAALGVRAAASLAELVAQADTVVTMLRTGAQTEALLLGDDGLAAAGASGCDVVVMSTMDPASMEALAAAAAARGVTVVDAPVSGGVRGAEAATL